MLEIILCGVLILVKIEVAITLIYVVGYQFKKIGGLLKKLGIFLGSKISDAITCFFEVPKARKMARKEAKANTKSEKENAKIEEQYDELVSDADKDKLEIKCASDGKQVSIEQKREAVEKAKVKIAKAKNESFNNIFRGLGKIVFGEGPETESITDDSLKNYKKKSHKSILKKIGFGKKLFGGKKAKIEDDNEQFWVPLEPISKEAAEELDMMDKKPTNEDEDFSIKFTTDDYVEPKKVQNIESVKAEKSTVTFNSVNIDGLYGLTRYQIIQDVLSTSTYGLTKDFIIQDDLSVEGKVLKKVIK